MISTSINDMLDKLDEEDYNMVVNFVQYLLDSQKKRKTEASKKILKEIQNMFSDDRGWDDEESMIADMAAFKKKRNKN